MMHLSKKHILSGLLPALLILFVASCSEPKETNVQEIVDAVIAKHGGDNLDKSIVTFKFRDKQYRALRDNGAFVYSRSFVDDSTRQNIHDVLSNSGFKRSIDDAEVDLLQEKKDAYTASVNSVIYFALLPYFLNDAAVQKEYLGEAVVKGASYHKVKVTFAKENGGEDFEDEFVYWFHTQNNTLDYLAYSYKEKDGIGTRFREAVNPREIGGVRIQDYNNYTAPKELPLENFDKAFEAGKLEKVSEINLEDVKVSRLQ
jgi:hypothetical protein